MDFDWRCLSLIIICETVESRKIRLCGYVCCILATNPQHLIATEHFSSQPGIRDGIWLFLYYHLFIISSSDKQRISQRIWISLALNCFILSIFMLNVYVVISSCSAIYLSLRPLFLIISLKAFESVNLFSFLSRF